MFSCTVCVADFDLCLAFVHRPTIAVCGCKMISRESLCSCVCVYPADLPILTVLAAVIGVYVSVYCVCSGLRPLSRLRSPSNHSSVWVQNDQQRELVLLRVCLSR